jgi:hypothetical protein
MSVQAIQILLVIALYGCLVALVPILVRWYADYASKRERRKRAKADREYWKQYFKEQGVEL